MQQFPPSSNRPLSPQLNSLRMYLERIMREDRYVYFKALEQNHGPEATVDGQSMIMVGSNDYLGLAHNQRVINAAARAMRRWGTGPGGSRFLCGNLTLHEELETALADFVGKAGAVMHPTGFLTNAGSIPCLVAPSDVLLCDRECHASIVAGCRLAGVRQVTYKGEDPDSARKKLTRLRAKPDTGRIVLITEGLFSMSGRVTDVAALARLREVDPNLFIYVDDAHGLGVMGNGRTTMHQFNAVAETDMIMGTFSKALGSIGGFVAMDDPELLVLLKHASRTHMFSAGLSASNAAAALESLRIIQEQPQRVQRLWRNTERARKQLQRDGLPLKESSSPIIAIPIGDEMLAFDFSQALFKQGVFALPAVFPAVPKDQAILRVAFTSQHTRKHIDKVTEAIAETAKQFGILS